MGDSQSETRERIQARHGGVSANDQSLRASVAARIREAIVSGTLQPGQRLVEDRLAKELEVSRHPVREALRTLQLEGFVEISPRRGATVSRLTTEDASELFEVLAALDGLAARLAANKRKDPAVRQINQILESATNILQVGSSNLSSKDLAELAEFNRSFHGEIADASANRPLVESITSLRDRLQWIQAAVNRRRPELSWSEHASIRQAIAVGDADTAETLARAHIEAARVVYLKQRPAHLTPQLRSTKGI